MLCGSPSVSDAKLFGAYRRKKAPRRPTVGEREGFECSLELAGLHDQTWPPINVSAWGSDFLQSHAGLAAGRISVGHASGFDVASEKQRSSVARFRGGRGFVR